MEKTLLIPNKNHKEAFVRTIKAIRTQKDREEAFGKTVKQAFIDAGECEDFRDRQSYEPPTNMFMDELLEAIAFNFVGPYQTQEEALDHINYFVYELELMNYVFMEPTNPKEPLAVEPVPAYYYAKDGTKLPLATPEDLYESLIYEMFHEGRKTVDREYREDPKPEAPSEARSKDANFVGWANDTQADIWGKLRPMVENNLCVDDISPLDMLGTDLYADSLDTVELCMEIEKTFNINLTDDDYYTVDGHTQCRELVELIEKKMDEMELEKSIVK